MNVNLIPRSVLLSFYARNAIFARIEVRIVALIRLNSSEITGCIEWQVVTDVSEVPNAFTLKVDKSMQHSLTDDLQYGSSAALREGGNCLPVDTA